MKIKFVLCLLIIVLSNLLTSQSLLAQKKNKGSEAAIVGAGILGGIIATKLAVEEIKEQLESDAVTHILSNYPEINEFRLKCVFEKGEKWSDDSETGVITFQLTVLDKSRKTHDRKILLRFNNNNFMNEYGVRVNKVEYMMLEKHEWDSMLAFFVKLMAVGDTISPYSSDDNIADYIVPLYTDSDCQNYKAIKAMNYNLMGEETYKCYEKTTETEYLSRLKLKKNGLEYQNPNQSYNSKLYPFYRLKGDDYIVGDFSTRFKIFSNEKTMGLFLKSMNKSILLSRNIIEKIHSFLNFQDIRDYNNSSSASNFINSINSAKDYTLSKDEISFDNINLGFNVHDEVYIKYQDKTSKNVYYSEVKLNRIAHNRIEFYDKSRSVQVVCYLSFIEIISSNKTDF